MSVLLDTNILAPALAAVKGLEDEGERLYIVPQNLYEFWAVCT